MLFIAAQIFIIIILFFLEILIINAKLVKLHGIKGVFFLTNFCGKKNVNLLDQPICFSMFAVSKSFMACLDLFCRIWYQVSVSQSSRYC